MSPRTPKDAFPLSGKWIVNTRAPQQAQELDALLQERRAQPLSYPCIDIAPALDTAPLDEALKRAAQGAFDWVAFTSANAVEAVAERLRQLGIAPKRMTTAMLAAVGPGTAAAVSERLGLSADLCPDENVAESLARKLLTLGARRVLVPQAERAREDLVGVLRESAVDVRAVTAYRTIVGTGGVDLPLLLREGRVDAVIFASPSAIENMAVRFAREGGVWEDLKRVRIACIGPVTADAAGRRGLEQTILPQAYTLPDLVNALESFYRHEGRDTRRVS